MRIKKASTKTAFHFNLSNMESKDRSLTHKENSRLRRERKNKACLGNSKKVQQNWRWAIVQSVGCLPSKGKALGSVLRIM